MAKKKVKWKNKTEKNQYLKALIADEKENPTSYEMKDGYAIGDFIEHTKFGIGFVQGVLDAQKIQVFFESSERVLLHNWKK